MSYYMKHPYAFTTHAIQRIRQRLNFKDIDDYKLKEEVLKMIELSLTQFENNKNIYFESNIKGVYIVVEKNSNAIVTVTRISPFYKLLK